MDYTANTQSNVKYNNQKIILQLLVNEGPMSRADLALKMNSSKPTISKNIEELIKVNKVVEIGKADNLIGKKAILVDIHGAYGYVLAIDLSKSKFNIVLSNLKKEWLYYFSEDIDTFLEEVDTHIEDNKPNFDVISKIKNFFQTNQIDVDKIMLVSIAYPGVVGHNDLVYLTNLEFKELLLNKLIPYFKETLKKPVIIKNDINLATISEKRYGKFSDKENLYLLSADVGVGLGIVINHQLYEGDRNAAGEVGFVLPMQQKNGQYYTLEDKVSIHALTKRYSIIQGKKIGFNTLIEDILASKPQALNIYEDVKNDLIVAITNIASILDIKTVIVEGRVFDLNPYMIDELNQRINLLTPFETVVTKTVLVNKALNGAIAIGVEVLIDNMIKTSNN